MNTKNFFAIMLQDCNSSSRIVIFNGKTSSTKCAILISIIVNHMIWPISNALTHTVLYCQCTVQTIAQVNKYLKRRQCGPTTKELIIKWGTFTAIILLVIIILIVLVIKRLGSYNRIACQNSISEFIIKPDSVYFLQMLISKKT